MGARVFSQSQSIDNTSKLNTFIRSWGVDIAGIADLSALKAMTEPIADDPADLLGKFNFAVVMGSQLDKLGRKATGLEVDLFLEKVALETTAYLEGKGFPAFIVHPEDEFDPVRRIGLLPLKVLAKAAGLGWQGRSLLIVSPVYGPVHRWIAVLTNLELHPGEPVPNQCSDCRICIEKCPGGALRFVPFADHPDSREDVLDIRACKGDAGCLICLRVCPRGKQKSGP